jgi:hypothetical protein
MALKYLRLTQNLAPRMPQEILREYVTLVLAIRFFTVIQEILAFLSMGSTQEASAEEPESFRSRLSQNYLERLG